MIVKILPDNVAGAKELTAPCDLPECTNRVAVSRVIQMRFPQTEECFKFCSLSCGHKLQRIIEKQLGRSDAVSH